MEAGRKVYDKREAAQFAECVDEAAAKLKSKRPPEQPDEKGLLPDYGCTKSGKACTRCKKRYCKVTFRFCSDCLVIVEEAMHRSGYLQEVPEQANSPDGAAVADVIKGDIRRADRYYYLGDDE